MTPVSIPSLRDKITLDDVKQKGKGSYAVDYVSWAKCADLMNQHANGWRFNLRQTSAELYVHAAPDGTGYLVGYWISPTGEEQEDFPYAITDHTNKPIALDKISSAAIANSHRRCYCAAACFKFNLAFQLWAREEIEAAEASTSGPVSAPAAKSDRKAGKAKEARQPAAEPEGPGPISTSDREELIAALALARESNPDNFSKFAVSFTQKFAVPEGNPIRDYITNMEHYAFCQQFLNGSRGGAVLSGKVS